MQGGEPQCVCPSRNALGEVPLWCTRTQRLWWIDVKAPSIQSFDPSTGALQTFALQGRRVGSWAFRERGGMVLAMADGLHAFDPASGTQEALLQVEVPDPQRRLNDGRCDRLGRFWVGSMHESERRVPLGTFYRISPALELQAVFDGFSVPNSVAFSPDDRRLYFADSLLKSIFVFDFDIEQGRLSNQRLFARCAGIPDGSTVDVDGCLWNAEFGSGKVVRYTPQGEVDRVIRLPVAQVTSCAFGGPAMDTLFVTTGAQNLDADRLRAQPHAGGVFALRPGVQGLAEPRFAG